MTDRVNPSAYALAVPQTTDEIRAYVDALRQALNDIDQHGTIGSEITVRDEGTALTTAMTELDFVGAGVTVANHATPSRKTVTIPSAAVGGLPFATGDSIGLVGDNSTNNTTALQTWHDGLPNTVTQVGGTLMVKPGRYRFTGQVNLSKSGVCIVGMGGASQKMGGSDTGVGVEFIANTAGMKLLNIDPGGSSLNHLGPTIENINFYDNIGSSCTPVYIRGTNRWTFRNCAFSNALRGVHLWSDALSDGGATAGFDCAWGMFDQCYWKDNATGLYSQHSYGYTMLGGEFDINGIGIHYPGNATSLNNTSACRHFGVKFDANTVSCDINGAYNEFFACNFELRNTGATGIRLGNAFAAFCNSIVGCGFVGVFGDATGTGIRLDANAQRASTGQVNYLIANTHQTLTNFITEHATVAGINWIEGWLPNTGGAFGLQLQNNAGTPSTGTTGQIVRVGGTILRCSAANTWTAM